MGIAIARKIDRYLGHLFCFLLKGKDEGKVGKKNRVLIIKLSGIGDGILLLPSIKPLTRDHEVTLLISRQLAPIFSGKKYLRRIITVKSPLDPKVVKIILWSRGYFDYIIDAGQAYSFPTILAHLLRPKVLVGFSSINRSRDKLLQRKVSIDPARHMVFCYYDLCSLVGKIPKPKRLEKVEYSREDEELVGRIPIQRPYICISPGGSGSKVLVAWPEERFIELIRRLKGCSIVLTGDKNDKELCERIARDTPAISLAGNLTLKQLSCLYEGAACVVSNDSGPMHISAAMNAPTVGLFGPDTPIRYAPFGKGNISLYKKMHCSPCRKAYLASWNECKAQYCMQKILVGEVEQAVKNAVSAQPLRQLS
ncbi:glycosyltransferase family 9 protein [Candidatus Woesearchaeota archaeon]|nr:MAG: heptosyltransferase II [archaeon GW2011_AR4]MBS3129103.1 glycosyltransferase family 9 protein [Candidatus Woesearchaeota archaeon]HIH37835.1 glycosyltransferase family 9 protein [Candidatus Woesearchaeota archaeon]HIH49269.1 glycosyltransferase family 9 protein [Candidatus Woesearchaeota archaeon]HIJ03960.1 glycosyltransferase family 9 protein [Candidatus Woesearchaeota archaeon]